MSKIPKSDMYLMYLYVGWHTDQLNLMSLFQFYLEVGYSINTWPRGTRTNANSITNWVHIHHCWLLWKEISSQQANDEDIFPYHGIIVRDACMLINQLVLLFNLLRPSDTYMHELCRHCMMNWYGSCSKPLPYPILLNWLWGIPKDPPATNEKKTFYAITSSGDALMRQRAGSP